MGIVAYCPGGHRMKVKDHLAGRKGICPTCGSRFRIPLATAAGQQAGGPQAPGGMPLAAAVSLDPDLAATLPRAIALSAAAPPRSGAEPALGPTAAVDQESDAEVVVDADPEGHDLLSADLACAEPTNSVPAVIAEAAAAAWCTAIPGGDASPPMSADVLLDWLTSGRITGRELVWRSDWSEWRPVGQVFPDHVPAPPPTVRPAAHASAARK